MGRFTPVITNFNGGEWSEDLMGRFDIAKYQNACEHIENFIPTVLGSATRRTGTRYVASTKGDGVALLVPFEFSTVQTYVIEVGHLYMRFYRNRGRLESPPGTVIEIASPYTLADLPNLRWTQSADVMYLCDGAHFPQKLSRTSPTVFTIGNIDLRDGPYLDENLTATTITFGATTVGATTATASAAIFAATDVGRLIRIRSASDAGFAVITGFTSSTVVNVNVLNDIAGNGGKLWRLGAFSGTTGYPKVVTLHEERLTFGNTSLQPQTFWMSVSGDYELFQPTGVIGDTTINTTINADNAITFTLSDDRVNAIMWMSSGNTLLMGTTGGEVSVQASSLNEALTPSNITAKRQSTIGSANVNALRINDNVIYIQRNGKRAYQIGYQFDVNGYRSTETSLFSRHLLKKKIKALAFQQEPYDLIWAIDNLGNLRSVTFRPDQEVTAWARQPIAGLNGKVLSITTINGDGQDELWMIVERTIDGTTKRYVEYVSYEYQPEDKDDKSGAVFVDSSLEYDGAPATTISGLDHLIGQTISILGDGATHPDKVVSASGQISLDRPISKAQIGLGYRSLIITVPLEQGTADGSALGKIKRINEIAVKFLNTLGGKIGGALSQLEAILFRSPADLMDASPPLFKGNKEIEFPTGYEGEAKIVVLIDQPLPMTVLAMAPRLTAFEK